MFDQKFIQLEKNVNPKFALELNNSLVICQRTIL